MCWSFVVDSKSSRRGLEIPSLPGRIALVESRRSGPGDVIPLAEVATAVLDAASVVPVLALHPAIVHLLVVVEVLLRGASTGHVRRLHSGFPSVVFTDHLDDVAVVRLELALDVLGSELHVRRGIIATGLVRPALVSAQLEQPIAIGAVRFRIARRLLHGKGGEHDGRDPVLLGDGVEVGHVVFAGREWLEVSGEFDVDELVHGHHGGSPSSAVQAAVEPGFFAVGSTT